MKNKVYYIIVLCFVVLGMMAFPGKANAYSLNINGLLDGWGVTPGPLGASQWIPLDGIQYVVEEGNTDVGHGGHLSDAEAMYAYYNSKNLYFAIVTGQPRNGSGGYKPGDVAFDFGRDGSFEYAFETKNRETLTDSLTAGSLYSVKEWEYGLWNTYDPTQIKTIDAKLGDGKLAYNNRFYGSVSEGSHYVIEGSIPISLFGNDWGKDFTMSWTQTSGNDVIRLDVTPTPEPATMALFALGLGGLGVLRRRYA